MTINEIKQHVSDLLAEGTIPQANATLALEFLNHHNVNQAIACIIEFI
jgi:hypothetical protein